MIVHPLHRAGTGKLLLFFNGWGMDDSVFDGWESSGFDVLTVCDYTSPEPLPDLSGYGELHLAAWSLGVRVAADLLADSPHRFVTATAFNGTLRPVDAAFGIDPAVFAGTIAHWSDERARERFFRRLAGNARFRRPARSWESQRGELAALERRFSSSPVPPDPFRTARIGGRDRIIPAAAQREFWRGQPVSVVETPETPHFPFAAFRSFGEVVDAGRNR